MAYCCGGIKKQVVLNIEKINKNQMKELNTFLEWMPSILEKLGPTGKISNLSTDDIVRLVEYDNLFLKNCYSCHVHMDCINSIMDMKSFYHSAKRGDIQLEEEEKYTELDYTQNKEDADVYKTEDEITVSRTCVGCGVELHRLSKGDLCKKCK